MPRPSWARGKMKRTRAPLTLMMPAPPKPCRTRPATSSGRVVADGAAERGERVEHQAPAVDPAVAVDVAQGRERQQADGDRELVGVDHPDRVGRRGVHVVRDGRQGDVGDRADEHRHARRRRRARPWPEGAASGGRPSAGVGSVHAGGDVLRHPDGRTVGLSACSGCKVRFRPASSLCVIRQAALSLKRHVAGCRSQGASLRPEPADQQTEDDQMQIGVVGLGRMGANISRRLMQAGHSTVVWDANPAAVESLGKDGATAASGLADLVGKLYRLAAGGLGDAAARQDHRGHDRARCRGCWARATSSSTAATPTTRTTSGAARRWRRRGCAISMSAPRAASGGWRAATA